MLGSTQARPWAVFAVIWRFAELHAQIHRREARPGSSRCKADHREIEASGSPGAEKQAARDCLAELPGRRLDIVLDAYLATAPLVARPHAPHVEVPAVL